MNGQGAFELRGNERPARVAWHRDYVNFSGCTLQSRGVLGSIRLTPRDSLLPGLVRRVAPVRSNPPKRRRSLSNGRVIRARTSLRRKAWQLRATEGGANASPSVCVSSFRHVHEHGEAGEQRVAEVLQGVASGND
jgi:hypothetical protein